MIVSSEFPSNLSRTLSNVSLQTKGAVSSTKLQIFMSCKKKKRSFKYRLKSRGSSTDPCGTPLIRSVQALKVVFIFTVIFCFSSSCKLNLKHISQNHMHEVSFAINTSKFIVTKTLQRSISIVPAKSFLSS